MERPIEDKYEDHLGLIDIDHVEFYCNNAKQIGAYYQKLFGFQLEAHSGLITGNRETSSWLLSQGNIRFLLTSPLNSKHPIAEHCKRHGDGVRDIAMQVKDVDKAFAESVKRGATAVMEPQTVSDEQGEVRRAAIATYGETIHSFIDRSKYDGDFLPGFMPVEHASESESVGVHFVDHIVGNVELGKMEHWVNFYRDVLGFEQYIHFDDNDIATEYSALMSKVMAGGRGMIKFPINEPADGKRKSQIQEYLDYYEGPGVQHLALLTPDIVATVRKLHENGVEFLRTPSTYYDDLQARVGSIDENVDDLKELGILVDRDNEGYLLQIFSKPVSDRPTFFFEIIQRKGARGFGIGNFKALFEAIEREQEARGNL